MRLNKKIMLIWLLIQPLWAIQSQACRELFDPRFGVAENRSALLESAKKGKLNELKTFLETVDSKQLEQNKLVLEETLMIAIKANHPDIVKYLLSLIQNSQPHQQLPDSILLNLVFSEKSMEDLIIGSGHGVQKMIQTLIESGFDFKRIKDNGDTLLHTLVSQKHSYIVQKVFKRNQDFRTSLQLQSAYLSVLRILHELGVETYKPIRDKEGNTLAHAAARGGNSKVIQELYNLGHQLSLQNHKGETVWDLMKQHKNLFHNGSYRIYQKIAREFLLDQIKNKEQLEDQILIDILSESVLTAEEFKELLPEIIKKGVNPNATNAHGEPALHLAFDILVYALNLSSRYIDHTQKKLIYAKALIDNGADIKTLNKAGDSILHVELNKVIKNQYSKASVDSFIKKLEFIIYDQKLNPNIRNKAGKTIIDILQEKLNHIKDRNKKRQIKKMIEKIKEKEKKLDIRIKYKDKYYWWTRM